MKLLVLTTFAIQIFVGVSSAPAYNGAQYKGDEDRTWTVNNDAAHRSVKERIKRDLSIGGGGGGGGGGFEGGRGGDVVVQGNVLALYVREIAKLERQRKNLAERDERRAEAERKKQERIEATRIKGETAKANREKAIRVRTERQQANKARAEKARSDRIAARELRRLQG